jgi:alpha-glucoside transport system substrate-binding protein
VSRRRARSRLAVASAGIACLGLTVVACGGGREPPIRGAAAIDCSTYSPYGELKGKIITVYTSIVTPEDASHIDSYKPFEQCTGATVKYEGDKAFETEILDRVRAGNLPDLAIVPQPGLLQQLVATGAAKEPPPEVSTNADRFWGPEWKAYGTVSGTFYAAPLGANVKSLVWYSPSEFQEKGLKPPVTLDELARLTDKLATGGHKPWCAGITSGEATGWPVTDWMEDMMLRLSGPQEYDKWVRHEIPFNSPGPMAALDEAGRYLKNDRYVNGGLGDVNSIARTSYQDGGLPILEGACSLHRQASFYAANWPEGTRVAADGDVFAFYLPSRNERNQPVLGGGDFALAFADRPEVKAFQTYLSTDLWANNKVVATPNGGWVSANKGLDVSKLTSPIDKLAADILQDPDTVFRFDGSDLMPTAVGSNAFWKQATNWITGQSTQETLANIESAWPK